MSYGIMWIGFWGGVLGARPGWKDMSPFGSTLGGGAGAAYGVASGVFDLRGGVGEFVCCRISFVGGDTCGGASMLKFQ